MNLSIRTLNIIFSISLLLLASAFIYSYLNIQGLRSANHWVNHTNNVIRSLESIYSDIKSAESGVRGYALTKDASHLEQQTQSRTGTKNHLHLLDSLVEDNVQQHMYVDTLHKIVNERFFLFNGLINLTNNNADQSEVIPLMQKGKATTDHIYQVVQKMKANEEVILVQRTEKAEALDKTTPITIVFSGILGFLVLVVSYYFILADLKQRRRITNEVKVKNTLLEYVQQIAQMGTFEYIVHSQTIFWSNEMYNIFEVDKTITPKMDFIDSLITDDMELVHKRRKDIFEPNKSYSHEFNIRTHSGKEKVLISNGYVVSEANGLVVHGAIIDITPLKKAELTALEQQKLMRAAKEKAESASQFKTRFLSNMSHEIRTPINAILGFTNILTKQQLTAQQKDLLKNITISGELLLKLIGNILDISKIEEGKVTIESKSFHLKEMTRSVLSPFQHSASEKGLQFHLIIDESIPDYLLGDFSRISQVLVNLIGNALKFTSHGNITVSVLLNKNQDGFSFVEFAVSDTGIGVQADKQEEIFDSFTQANESISIKYGGSGLGLSIVQEIVHLMGGEIKVQSPVHHNERGKGYGSKFFFTIPFRLGERITDGYSKKDSVKPFPRKVHVLVADDNEMNRTLATYTLQSLGCTFEIVEDGLQAINKAAENNYDIILMDMQMPVCDGLQATRQIRKSKNTTPIVGLTANVFQEDINRCLDAGMDAHLGKPYTEEDLYHVIAEWVFKNKKEQVSHKPAFADYEFIEKLSKNDPAIFREMLEMFLNQNKLLLKEIQAAIHTNDVSALSYNIHQYKSCVRMLSIEKQIAIIKKIEQKIEERAPAESLKNDVKQLIETGGYVSEEINKKLLTV